MLKKLLLISLLIIGGSIAYGSMPDSFQGEKKEEKQEIIQEPELEKTIDRADDQEVLTEKNPYTEPPLVKVKTPIAPTAPSPAITATPEYIYLTPEPEPSKSPCNKYVKRSKLSSEEYNYYRAKAEAEVNRGLAINKAKRFFATCNSHTCTTSYVEMVEKADSDYNNTLKELERIHNKRVEEINETCYEN